jgi:hypothetical protein
MRFYADKAHPRGREEEQGGGSERASEGDRRWEGAWFAWTQLVRVDSRQGERVGQGDGRELVHADATHVCVDALRSARTQPVRRDAREGEG